MSFLFVNIDSDKQAGFFTIEVVLSKSSNYLGIVTLIWSTLLCNAKLNVAFDSLSMLSTFFWKRERFPKKFHLSCTHSVTRKPSIDDSLRAIIFENIERIWPISYRASSYVERNREFRISFVRPRNFCIHRVANIMNFIGSDFTVKWIIVEKV